MSLPLALAAGLAAPVLAYTLAPKTSPQAILGEDKTKILAGASVGAFGGLVVGAWGILTLSPAALAGAVGLLGGAMIVRESVQRQKQIAVATTEANPKGLLRA